MPTTISAPSLIKLGKGALKETGDVLKSFGLKYPLIVTDPYMRDSGMVGQVVSLLKDGGFNCEIFADTIPDPTDTVVEAGVRELQSQDFDCIIGFGGGSPIDTAKAIAVLAAGEGKMREHKVPNLAEKAAVPVIAIPTTAGTGSEVTQFTIITDAETEEKMLIKGSACMPVAAIVDYTLTMSVPYRTTADTGVDTLTHAIEAYVSRLANPHSDVLARSAMELVAKHLRAVCKDPQNEEAREGMMLAAHHGGMAFSNSSVCLVHGMSRPIGAGFHVAHGLSNAMLLPAVTEYSIPAAEGRYADCARAMGLVENGVSDSDACTRLVEELRALNRDLEVPTPESYGINSDDWFNRLSMMAEQALASGSPNNNPKVPTADEIIELYTKVWEGR